jgi:hypothetical protein
VQKFGGEIPYNFNSFSLNFEQIFINCAPFSLIIIIVFFFVEIRDNQTQTQTQDRAAKSIIFAYPLQKIRNNTKVAHNFRLNLCNFSSVIALYLIIEKMNEIIQILNTILRHRANIKSEENDTSWLFEKSSLNNQRRIYHFINLSKLQK